MNTERFDLLQRILDTSRQMAETRTLFPLLDYAMDAVISFTKAERGHLVLTKPDGTFDVRVTRGQHRGEHLHTTDQISTSILYDVISQGQPIVLRDASGNSQYMQSQSVRNLNLRSVMCVPLISRGNTIGAIYVENRSVQGRFSEADLPPLVFLANQAAVSIENAALNDELEERIAIRTRELEEAKGNAEQSWVEAVEANRLRTVLLSNITHDLRVPLTVVVGTLSMLEDGDMGLLNDEQLEWINNSLKATKHILTLIDDMFDLTKLELGNLALYKEMINLNDFMKSIYDVGRGLPWPRTVTLKLELPPNLPYVYIDPNRIRQVLLNLLSNALKFTTDGSVTLYAQNLPENQQVLIGVVDTGEGIAAENLEKLFKRFQQFDGNIDRRQTGTGLGLAISRELVERHNGRIWAESTLGVGTNFKFVVPTTPLDHTFGED